MGGCGEYLTGFQDLLYERQVLLLAGGHVDVHYGRHAIDGQLLAITVFRSV
jgi:hypothetical protein